MPNRITQITGPHCHLCDSANALLYPLLEAKNIQLKELNIKDDKTLFEQYSLLIPVIIFSDGSEKGWPFTAAQLARYII